MSGHAPSEPASHEVELVVAAQRGDRGAFDRLFAPAVTKLRGVLQRMVGHPDEVDDLAQQALLRAYESIAGFERRSSASTWLCAIGARLAIDHLRAQQRWRAQAQSIFAARALESEAIGGDVAQAMGHPDYAFDVREHIAYCFTCVGRSLEPEAQAALILRDVLEMSNDEAARALGLTGSVLRHRLTQARSDMQTRFEGLCSLVGKQGLCYQCAGLREVSPEGKRGQPPPEQLDWPRRLQVVREAALCEGSARALHEVFFRHTTVQEAERLGDDDAQTTCGKP